MSRITSLENHIDQVKGFLEEDLQKLKSSPNDLFLLVSVRSNRHDLDQLQSQLKAEKEKRLVEVLDIRLKSSSLQDGTIPLSLLAKIADLFSVVVYASSTKFKTGKDTLGRFSNDILESVDLRLSGLLPGSTHLVLTGKTNPDILGYSVFEESLKNLYKTLDCNNQESISDELSNLGSRGTKSLAGLVDLFIKSNIEADFVWNDPGDKVNIWSGDSAEIERMHQILSNNEVQKPIKVTIYGKVTLLSDSGRIIIENEHGKHIHVSFSRTTLPIAKRMNLGQRVYLQCEKQTIRNRNTDKLVDYYHLIDTDDMFTQ